MAEFSYWWTTSGSPIGDQVASYTQAHLAAIARILAACAGFEGIAPGYLNKLAGTVAGANTVAINTGGAVVDGKVYENGASVNVNIPSASGGGNTRIDRIVLRVSWAGFTARITRIAGVDAASPSVPAITQTSGTTYDLPLYQALVNTSGAVSLTSDERVFAATAVDNVGIEFNGSRILQLKDSGVTAAKLATNAVTTAKIADANVTTAKILDLNVTTSKIANDAIDDTKVGNRVPQFYRRKGGDPSDWHDEGANSYTPTTVRMQAGAVGPNTILSTPTGQTVTFPIAFSNIPIVMITAYTTNGLSSDAPMAYSVSAVTASQFSYIVKNLGTDIAPISIFWLAIGPE